MIRIQQFSGIAPKISQQLLPDNMAVTAKNCRLLSGELRGLHELELLRTFSSTTNYAVRIPSTPDDVWVGFSQVDIDFAKGPLINDAYDRYYWTGEEPYLSYNTLARIANGDPAYKVGVPTPSAAMSVTPDGSGDPELAETRAYVYTFVNEYGEESAPSTPQLADGYTDDVWQLTGISATPPDMTDRAAIVKRRIYRTVTGQASALFYHVADIDDMVTTTYDDSTESTDVVSNTVCETFNWDPPPDELHGLTAHPAGFFAAFNGREVFLSETYRPWAWPVEYILAVEHDIVGLAIYGNMLMVMTTSNPYYFAGTHPSNLSPIKSESVEPCLSKRGIVATLQGVLYPSPNGLVLFNQQGANVVTNSIISRAEWQQQFSPGTLKATQRGLQYIAFQDTSNGFEYSPAEPLGQFSTLDRFTNVSNVLTDRYTGEVLILADNSVYLWDPVSQGQVFYTWKSKEFDLPRPLNFGAAIVKMDSYIDEASPIVNAEGKEAWNTTRMAFPMQPIGYTPVAAPRTESLSPVGWPPNYYDETLGADRNRYPLGGSPLFITDPSFSPTGSSAFLRVYADRQLVANLTVRPNQTMRLPSGFKAHFWQFEVLANVSIYSIAVAETAKGLMNV